MIRFAVRPPEDETPPTDRIIGTTRPDIVWSGFFLATFEAQKPKR